MNGIHLTIAGNLTRDPEVSTVGSGASLAKFSVAVERSWRKEDGEWEKATSFVDVVCWRNLADDAEKLLQKGMRVMVTGRMDQQSWDDKETGKTRSRFEVTADEIAVSLRAIESIERRQYDSAASNGSSRSGDRRSGAQASRAPFDDAIWS